MTTGITFDEASHRYTLDGKAVPGVSEIIEAAYDFRFVDAAAMEKARDLGKKVHKTVELFEQGTLDEKTLHPLLHKRLDGYKRFKDDYRYVSVAQEEKVASRKYGFCGTLDNRGLLLPAHVADPEEELLLDVKTGDEYAPHKLQTAGYKIAAVEMQLLNPNAKRLSLYLDEDGYRVRWHTHNAMDEVAFISLRNFYHWSKHHG